MCSSFSKKALQRLGGPRLLPASLSPAHYFDLGGTSWLRAAKSWEWHLSLPHLSGHHLHLGPPLTSRSSGQLLTAVSSVYVTLGWPPQQPGTLSRLTA